MAISLDDKTGALPRRPGVYLMKERRGRVIYVGKARDLRARVSSYFAPSRLSHPRTDAMVARIADFDVIVTDTELDALILEQSLIKEYRPRYNVKLADDKRYPYLRVTLGHRFPGIEITRQTGDRSSRYFGPYADVASLRHTVKRLRRAFPLRVCSDQRVMQKEKRECLDYFIGSCCAPCTRRVSDAEYDGIVRAFTRFLGGSGQDVLNELQEEMAAAAAERRYERAAVFRDRIRAAQSVLRRQNIEAPGGDDLDVIGIATGEDVMTGTVLRIRSGRLIGKEDRRLVRTQGRSRAEALGLFVMQYYLGGQTIPGRVVLPFDPEEPELVGAWLTRRADRAVEVHVPRRGRLAGLVRVATRNASLVHEEKRVSARGDRPASIEVQELQSSLGLSSPPIRIEGVDVSTLHGTDQVASVVVFVDGKPQKNLYRRFRVRRIEGADDFASIQEIVDRRISRAVSEGKSLPDLLLIDGGEGQLSAAQRALEKYDVRDLPMIGLAKREERIVFPDGRNLRLSRRSEALKLLQRVRNEAHRFAVSYHRRLRARRLRASALDDISGIGPQRKALLLRTFGSIDGLRDAGVEKIASLPGIGRATARRIVEALEVEEEKP